MYRLRKHRMLVQIAMGLVGIACWSGLHVRGFCDWDSATILLVRGFATFEAGGLDNLLHRSMIPSFLSVRGFWGRGPNRGRGRK